MFIAIVQHTPVWVWGLLAGLVALGLSQTRDREMSLARVTVMPLVLLGLSLSGVSNAFGHFPVAFGGWAAGVGAALVFGRQFIAVRGAAWSSQRGLLQVPGSWLPLLLIVGLFAVKYGVGVSLAMHPEHATEAGFAFGVSLAYGAFSGLFLARTLALRRLATRHAGLRAA
jgi:hypothetical protein